MSLGEAILGSDTYWCGYIQNDHPSETIKNVVIFIDSNTQSENDEVQIGLGTSGKNGTEQVIANVNTAPTNVEFQLAPTYNQGVFIGDLAPGDEHAFWLWRHIDVSTKEEVKNNKFELIIAFDPPPGSTGGGSGSGGGQPGGGGSPSPGQAPPNTKISSAGDWSLSSDAQNTAENMESFDPDIVLSLGDNSYEDEGDEWAEITEDLREDRIFKMCFGNHEREEGTPQPELTEFYLQLADMEETYGTFVHNGIMFIIIDCYRNFGVGSTQYNKIKQELENAKNNSSIFWRIALFHEPMYTSPTEYSGVSSLRNAYHPLFVTNNVDFALCGHNHNYQRSYPLAYNSGSPSSPTKIQDSQEPNYLNYAGSATMFLTIGSAGRDTHQGISSQNSYTAKTLDDDFGFVLWEMTNQGRTMTGKFYRNNGNLFDEWTVTK